MNLLRKLFGSSGKVHDIIPEGSGWHYVGFGLYRLRMCETVSEAILVMVEGKAYITGAG